MNIRSRLLPALFLIPLFAGCAGLDVLEPVEDTARFHLLDTGLDPEAAEALDPDGRAVVVGPVTLAEHLRRSGIATRGPDGTEIRYSPGHRWAGPLDELVTDLLVNRLSEALQSARVGPERRMPGLAAAERVGFHIDSLGGTPGDGVRLQVRWWIASPAGDIRHMRTSLLEESLPGSPDPFADYLRAQRRILTQWAAEVATALRDL
jgi:uncharacterized lipoprotein YmbA